MPGVMPRLGLGTYEHDDPEVCAASVRRALEIGYRHVDTAQGYENEESVGRGIRESSVDREDVFLATKLTTDNLAYDDVVHSTKESLDRLGVDSVDLIYVHWPLNTYDPADTLPALDELVDRGWVDHVGVSNFEPRHLEEARDILENPIFGNQVEMHPMLPQDELLADARDHDYWVVAYSPIARGEFFDHPAIARTADRLDCTPAQVCLAWLLDRENVAAIPKATGDHVDQNYGAVDIELDAEARETIDGIAERHRVVDFDAAPWHASAD